MTIHKIAIHDMTKLKEGNHMNVLTQMTPGSSKRLSMTGFVQALALGTLFMFAAILTSTSAQPEPKTLGTYKDWIAYTLDQDDGNQICYIVSEPTEKLPRNVNHGNVYMVISDWPDRNTKNEPSLLVGYDLKENSAVTAQIGGEKWEMFFDLGAYGIPPAVKRKGPWDGREMVRKMEKYTRDVKGYQLLYADTFMTREEFREMFDHTLYDKVRKKYKAESAFPDIYDKIKPEDWIY